MPLRSAGGCKRPSAASACTSREAASLYITHANITVNSYGTMYSIYALSETYSVRSLRIDLLMTYKQPSIRDVTMVTLP